MKIIISGYGRMGKEIERLAQEAGHEIFTKIDNNNDWNDLDKVRAADVVIDFSQPEVAIGNIERCFSMKIPIVTGTTGWYQHLDEVTATCRSADGTLFYAPNFSLGVNLFFLINKKLAKAMSPFGDEYKVVLKETHHIHKLDSPSGTAIKAAEDLISNHKDLTGWKEGKIDQEGILSIISLREGEVPGTHRVIYESEADRLELVHTAKNRSGFAKGALLAAEWVKGKKGVFNMDDYLKSIL